MSEFVFGVSADAVDRRLVGDDGLLNLLHEGDLLFPYDQNLLSQNATDSNLSLGLTTPAPSPLTLAPPSSNMEVDDFAGDSSTTGVIQNFGDDVLGRINFSNDEDWFAINLTLDDVVVIESQQSVTFSLRDENGTFFAFSQPVFRDNGFVETLTIKDMSGLFYVSVEAIQGSGSGDVFDYILETSAIDDDFRGDTTTTGVLSAEGTASGMIQFEGDVDWFAIEATAGDIIRIRSQTTDGFGNTELTLYDGNGNFFTSGSFPGGSNFDSEVVIGSGFSSTFYVGVSSFSNMNSYNLVSEIIDDDFSGDASTTGVITVGQSTSGEIQYQNDSDWFRIDLTEGDIIRVASAADVAMQLVDSLGNVFAISQFPNDPDSNFTSELILDGSLSGTFYVRVGSFSGDLSYTLEAETVMDDFAGNTSTQGTVSIGDTVTGSIDFNDDEDWFQLSITAGEIASFMTMADVSLRIVDAIGEVVLASSYFFTDENGIGFNRLDIDGSLSGDLFLAVMSFSFEGNYSLSSEFISDDFGNSFDTAGQLPDAGTISGVIDYRGDEDWFTITLDENDFTRLRLTSDQGADFELVDENGNRIAFSRFYDDQSGVFGEELVLDGAGTYYIRVESFFPSNFELDVADISGDIAGDVTTSASILQGDMLTGKVDFVGDNDWYALELTADDVIRLKSEGDFFELTLHDSSGDIIAFSEPVFRTNSGTSVQILFTALETGTYYVSVQPRFFGLTGDYQISADLVVDDFAGDITTTGVLALDGSVTGSIETSTDTDWFAVDLESDVRVEFQLQSDAIDDLRLELYDADGNLVQVSNEGNFTVTLSGRYYIAVANDGFGDFERDYQISAIERPVIQGTNGQDVLEGTDDDDVIEALNSSDRILSSFGEDIIDGGFGSDTFDASGEIRDLLIDLRQGASTADFTTIDAQNNGIVEDILSPALNSELYIQLNLTDGSATRANVTGVSSDTTDPMSGDRTVDFELSNLSRENVVTNGNLFPEINGRVVLTITQSGSDGSYSYDLNIALANTDFVDEPFDVETLTLNSAASDDEGLALVLLGSFDVDIEVVTETDLLSNIENIIGGRGNDTIFAAEGGSSINGGGGNDVIFGNIGNDRLLGGDFNDDFFGSEGADIINGQGGLGDGLSYIDSFEAVSLDFLTGTLSGGHAEGDVVVNVEGVRGSEFDDMIIGGNGVRVLEGGRGNDTLIAGGAVAITEITSILIGGAFFSDSQNVNTGDDTLIGSDGNDQLLGMDGADILDGRGGIDAALYIFDFIDGIGVEIDLAAGTADGAAAGDTLISIENVWGTNFDDEILGDSHSNLLRGESGNDSLDGRSGDDKINGGRGNDTLTGGTGSDSFVFNIIADGDVDTITDFEVVDQLLISTLVRGTPTFFIGQDAFSFTPGEIRYETGNGQTIVLIDLNGNGVADQTITISNGEFDLALVEERDGSLVIRVDGFVGTDENDEIAGAGADDVIYGLDGNDLLFGDDGNDTLIGEAGADRLFGQNGDDTLIGGSENDILVGGNGNDDIFGGTGNDRILGGTGDDDIEGGDGNDDILGGSGDDVISGGDGGDTIDGQANNDVIDGGLGRDVINGGNGRDIISGGDGDDVLRGDDGNDRIEGDAGDDFLGGGAGNDLLIAGVGDDRLFGGSGEDRLFGQQGDDLIFGGGGNDRLVGAAGNDILNGQSGDDILEGGSANDTLTGGGGSDIFVFARSAATTTVTDFTDGVDMLDLSDFSDADIEAALDSAIQQDADAVLTFANGAVLVLEGFDLDDLSAVDILGYDSPDMGMMA